MTEDEGPFDVAWGFSAVCLIFDRILESTATSHSFYLLLSLFFLTTNDTLPTTSTSVDEVCRIRLAVTNPLPFAGRHDNRLAYPPLRL